MRISLLYIASFVVGLAAAQERANPFTLPPGFMITAGQPTTITWDPTTQGTVSIRLRAGASSNLEEGTVVASQIDNNGKTTITLPADTTRNSDYALQIVSDSNPTTDVNYSAQFVVESKNTVKAASSPASSAAMTTAATMTSTAAATSATGATTSVGSSMTGASTQTTMSTRTGSSTRSASTGSTSSSTSSSGTATGASTSTTSAPSSGAVSLKVSGLLLAALIGAVVAW